jgi:hypothetical protein
MVVYNCRMRRLHDELFDLRVAPESLARWALETPAAAQDATYSAITFVLRSEYAAVSLLPAPELLVKQPGAVDPDGFLRQPRGAVEQFRRGAGRVAAWMELFIHFRERFPSVAARTPPEGLDGLSQAFSSHRTPLEAAVDLLVRECVVPELEELLARTLTYPPLKALLEVTRSTGVQRGAEARRLAAAVLGEMQGKRLWWVRKRLIATATRAILAARPLLEELERGGLKVDRARAAKGFARRLEEAAAELPGERVVPQALVARLAGAVSAGP